jgi:chorismate synthase
VRRLRLLTAGESHGPGMSGIVEGLPAGLRISTAEVNRDLARRQHGYGSGRRMLIEHDQVEWTAGLRFGRTLGSPLAFTIRNRDWQNWQERMSIERVAAVRRPRAVTLARPGHADLAGAIKYDTGDIRDVLERASARSTAPRVAAGSVCAQLLALAGVRIWSFVDQLGSVRAFEGADDVAGRVPPGWAAHDRLHPSPLRCPDAEAEARMVAEVDAVIEAGDSIGGSFVVVVEGLPIGLGSNAEWDTRLDAGLAGAIMGIQAVKGVEIGLGFGVVPRRGSQVHDEVDPAGPDWRRRTNRAGGVEGGMSNGAPIVVRAAVKPVATLRRPLDSVDLETGLPGRAHIERSDVAILPRAAVVGEAMVALVLADALLTSLGGNTVGDLRATLRRRRARSAGPRSRRSDRRTTAAGASPELEAFPRDAARDVVPVPAEPAGPAGPAVPVAPVVPGADA